MLVCLVCLAGTAGAAEREEPSTVGEKIVAFCKERKGQTVGNGECASLAEQALRAAGARERRRDNPEEGDYCWGELVYRIEAGKEKPTAAGKLADVKAGDVIQFRDVRLEGRNSIGRYTMATKHHTAIVTAVQEAGAVVKILHQNYNGKRVVAEETLRLGDLKEGWLRFYRPVPRKAEK
jgi:hypothetical protein